MKVFILICAVILIVTGVVLVIDRHRISLNMKGVDASRLFSSERGAAVGGIIMALSGLAMVAGVLWIAA